MLKKVRYLFSIYILFGMQFMHAQKTSSEYLLRSTLSVSGSSENVTSNNKLYIIQTSIGQASIIGTFKNSDYTLRQGFIQPAILDMIVTKSISLDLEATFYPNPFIESITLSFTEKIEGKVEVAVFDMLGRLVFSNNYVADQNLQVQFRNLPVANYILKVVANKKQFIKKILKN